MEPCPRCREAFEELEERIRQLKVAAYGEAKALPMEWRLTPSEAVLLRLLSARERVTFETYATAMSHERHDYAPGSKLIHVMVCNLRRKLGPYGVEIVNRFGQGYSIEEPLRSEVASAIDARRAHVGPAVTEHPRLAAL